MPTEVVIVPELEALAANYTACRTWSFEDEEALRNYHRKVSVKDLANYFNRSVSAVEHKIRRLGLGGEPC